jgi:hypothetical protein
MERNETNISFHCFGIFHFITYTPNWEEWEMRRLNGIGWNVFHRIPLHWIFTNSYNRTKIFTSSLHHLPSIQTRIELLATKLLGPKKVSKCRKILELMNWIIHVWYLQIIYFYLTLRVLAKLKFLSNSFLEKNF